MFGSKSTKLEAGGGSKSKETKSFLDKTISAVSGKAIKPKDNSFSEFGERFPEEDNKAHDVWAAILFFLVFVILITICAFNSSRYTAPEGDDLHEDFVWYARIVGCCTAGAVVVSLIFLQLLKKFPGPMMWVISFGLIALLITLIVLFFVLQNLSFAILSIVSLFLIGLYVFYTKERMEFTKAVVQSSSEVVALYPQTIAISAGGVIMQLAFAFLWVYTFVVSLPEWGQNISIFLAISLYWTTQVILNVIHTTVAGLIAKHYFLHEDMPPKPIWRSFKRSVSWSFGSICFGSFFVPFMRLIKSILILFKDVDNMLLRVTCKCITKALDWVFSFFNTYAFTQMSIYGKDWMTSARESYKQMKYSGFENLVSTNLIEPIVFFACLSCGLLCGICGGVIAYHFQADETWSIGFGCTIIGFIVCDTFLSVLLSAVLTVMVCFSEDSAPMKKIMPKLYEGFSRNFA